MNELSFRCVLELCLNELLQNGLLQETKHVAFPFLLFNNLRLDISSFPSIKPNVIVYKNPSEFSGSRAVVSFFFSSGRNSNWIRLYSLFLPIRNPLTPEVKAFKFTIYSSWLWLEGFSRLSVWPYTSPYISPSSSHWFP